MQRIKELRTEKKLTQAELGEKINSTQRQVSKWELGAIEPNITDLQKLADYFDVSIDYLVGRESEDGLVVPEGQSLSADEKELLEGFRRLNAAGKGRILGNLEGLLQASALFTDKNVK